MTKEEQTKKAKKKNSRRLSRDELVSYKDTIFDISGGLCQLCQEVSPDDYHHPFFGSYKDDNYLVAVCRECHTKCHQSKHGALNTKAKEIATENRRVHNG